VDVRAAVQIDDQKIEMQGFTLPSDLRPHEALVRIEACGMCGSDVSQYQGFHRQKGTVRYPNIPGHEPLGVIAEITPEARDAWRVDVGDRVAIDHALRCGLCDGCRGGGRCHHHMVYGFISTDRGAGLWGGYAEYMQLLPQTRVFPMSADLSVEDAVLFNPLAAGFEWAARGAGTEVGDSVLILGPGQRGLASVIAAREAGAETIIVTGLSRDRPKLELALEFGATHIIDAENEDVVAAAKEITGGRGVNRAVDVTTRHKMSRTRPMPDAAPPPDAKPRAAEPVNVAIAAAAERGTVVFAGHKGGGTVADFPADTVISKRLTIQGVGGTSPWSVTQAIRVITAGAYPLHKMHTHKITIDELEHGIAVLAGEVEGESAIHITVTPG
jgi:threonine dehydrogenase-like Zn-dependent dehydrogenase